MTLLIAKLGTFLLLSIACGICYSQVDEADIEGEYIIVLKRNVRADVLSLADQLKDIEIIQQTTVGRRSFITVRADNTQAIAALDVIQYVQPNKRVHLVEPVDLELAPRKGNVHAPPPAEDELRQYETQQNVSLCQEQSMPAPDEEDIWGLTRTSYRYLPAYATEPYQYAYDGTGVDIYIADTGIEVDHPDVAGRARYGMVSSEIWLQGEVDSDGHGTNVASLSGGTVFGIAKNASLISVKVLGTLGGTDTGIAEGIGWVVDQVKQQRSEGKTPRAVLNMSLGGPGPSTVLDDAVQEAVDEGIIVIVAAGNEADDASAFVPANQANTITVGATDLSDNYAEFSNYGDTVDISGPGVEVVGAYSSQSVLCRFFSLPPSECYVIISGTSQASPHVTGVVARYLSSLSDEDMAKVNQEVIRDMLAKTASLDYIMFNDSIHLLPTTNKLLYKNCGLTNYNLSDIPTTISTASSSTTLPTTTTSSTSTTPTTTSTTTPTTTTIPATTTTTTATTTTTTIATDTGTTVALWQLIAIAVALALSVITMIFVCIDKRSTSRKIQSIEECMQPENQITQNKYKNIYA